MTTIARTVDSITVSELGILSVRTATAVLENDVVIATAYHRNTLAPGSDLTGQDDKVVAVADAVWTPAVVAAYQAKLAETMQQYE